MELNNKDKYLYLTKAFQDLDKIKNHLEKNKYDNEQIEKLSQIILFIESFRNYCFWDDIEKEAIFYKPVEE